MRLCGIIKPHALNRANDILLALEASFALILDTKPICFTNELVEVLYDHMSLEAREAIARELVGLEGVAVLLHVPSIAWLLEIIGKESDPLLCVPGTIRARFGAHESPTKVGTDPWWQNAFHRPINAREAERDLSHIFDLRLEDS